MASNRNSVPCPDCGGKVRTITSRLLSDGVREIYFDCCNVDCLCRFVGHLGIVRKLPSIAESGTEAGFAMVQRRPESDIVVGSPRSPSLSTVAAPPPPGVAAPLPARGARH